MQAAWAVGSLLIFSTAASAQTFVAVDTSRSRAVIQEYVIAEGNLTQIWSSGEAIGPSSESAAFDFESLVPVDYSDSALLLFDTGSGVDYHAAHVGLLSSMGYQDLKCNVPFYAGEGWFVTVAATYATDARILVADYREAGGNGTFSKRQVLEFDFGKCRTTVVNANSMYKIVLKAGEGATSLHRIPVTLTSKADGLHIFPDQWRGPLVDFSLSTRLAATLDRPKLWAASDAGIVLSGIVGDRKSLLYKSRDSMVWQTYFIENGDFEWANICDGWLIYSVRQSGGKHSIVFVSIGTKSMVTLPDSDDVVDVLSTSANVALVRIENMLARVLLSGPKAGLEEILAQDERIRNVHWMIAR